MIIDNVSVVITTIGRSDIVCRAVNSVLSQTFRDIEVIVVIDGPDSATMQVLEQIKDPRLIILALPENVGVAEARNSGVRASKYGWIAFLDDDDEWLPEKLEKQAKAAAQLDKAFPIISCSYQLLNSRINQIRPLKFPNPSEQVSEYLFAKTSFFGGVAHLAPSALVMRKELLEAVPFRRHLWRNEDWDFLLRVAQLEEVSFEVVPECLVIIHIAEKREHLSNKDDVDFDLQWIRDNQNLFTPRAYAGYVAKNLSSEASRQKGWKLFVPLFKEMCRFGPPTFVEFSIFLYPWFLPRIVRRWVKIIIKKVRGIIGK
ncbi:MAG: glycosyltransferase family 2 protein [Nitrospirae bacterium]|nr:glycosyltransferase family 2 protein [Nitrospirota bacterium]